MSRAAAPEVTGYGFGLFEDFRSWGRTVYHSGGYPGLRVAHAVAPGVRAGDRRPRQRHLRTDDHGGHCCPPGPGRAAGRPASRRAASSCPTLQLAQDVVTDWLLGDDPDGDDGTPGSGRSAPTTSSRTCRGPSGSSSGDACGGRTAGCRSSPVRSPAVPWVGQVALPRVGRTRPVRVTVMLAPHDPTSGAVGRAAPARPGHAGATGRHRSHLSATTTFGRPRGSVIRGCRSFPSSAFLRNARGKTRGHSRCRNPEPAACGSGSIKSWRVSWQ